MFDARANNLQQVKQNVREKTFIEKEFSIDPRDKQ